MSQALTVDASVFVNAFSPTEAGNEQSWRFLTQIMEAEIPVFVPTLMLVEVVASLAHKQNNTTLASGWMETIQQSNFLTFLGDGAGAHQPWADRAGSGRGADGGGVLCVRRGGNGVTGLCLLDRSLSIPAFYVMR